MVKVWLHPTGDASPPHPNAAAALGTPAPAALLLPQILPVLPPHRANHARRGPRFSVVAPCRRGASPVSVRRQTFITGCPSLGSNCNNEVVKPRVCRQGWRASRFATLPLMRFESGEEVVAVVETLASASVHRVIWASQV